MEQSQRRLSELTIDEFVDLVRSTVRTALDEERQPPTGSDHLQARLLDLPPISLGELKPGMTLISREEYYDDER